MIAIKKGDKGGHVREIQERLVYHGARILVDGDYGRGTEKAVKYFQATHGLDVDGVVGLKTIEALRADRATETESDRPTVGGSVYDLIPKGLTGEREEVLKIALHEFEIGVKEIENNWSEEPEGGIAKYNDHDYDPQPWCMRYAKWVWKTAVSRGLMTDAQARLVDLLGDSGSCSKTWKRAKELQGRGEKIAKPMPVIPVPGDMGIMEGHVVLVLRVDVDGDGDFTINTVEGNSGNRVRVGKREGKVFVGFVDVFNDRCFDAFERGVVDADDVAGFSTR